MSKKNGQMQKKVYPPSAIMQRGNEGLKQLQKELTPQEHLIISAMPPNVQVLVGAVEFKRGFQMANEALSIIAILRLEVERMIQILARRCDKIDVLVGIKLDTQKLQDALGGDLRDTIQTDYDDIVELWDSWREKSRQHNLPDLGELGEIHQIGLKKMVDARLAALDALADGDDSLIRSLPPLDHDTNKLLNPVTKSGRKSTKDDLLTTEVKQLKESMSYAQILTHLRKKWKGTTDPQQAAALQLITRRPGDKSEDATIDATAIDLLKKKYKRA